MPTPDKLSLHELYTCNCPGCIEEWYRADAERLSISETENEELQKAFNKAARWIFREKKTAIVADDLNNKAVQPLMNTINSVLQDGYNRGINHNVPTVLQRNLSENVYLFSRGKTYEQLKELSSQLLNADGTIKPFSQFWQEAQKIYPEYNKAYLEAEYIFATSSAQMASKWNDYQEDGDRYNLQYRTAADIRVREEHAVLHNTTLPPSDPFWTNYYPPNGWRCRCTVVQVRKTKYPESDSDQVREAGAKATGGKNAIFRFNPGKQQVIFPPHHPYFKEQKAIQNVIGTEAAAKRRPEYEKLKNDTNYVDVELNDLGGLRATHKKHVFHPTTGHFEKEVQKHLYDNGHKIVLLAEEGIIPGKKHYDAELDDMAAEIKTITGFGKNTIKRAMQVAKRQEAKVAILYFPQAEAFSMQRLADSVAAYNGQTKHRFKDVLFITEGKVYRY